MFHHKATWTHVTVLFIKKVIEIFSRINLNIYEKETTLLQIYFGQFFRLSDFITIPNSGKQFISTISVP